MQKENQQLHFSDYSGIFFVSTNLLVLLLKLQLLPCFSLHQHVIFLVLSTIFLLILCFSIHAIHLECKCTEQERIKFQEKINLWLLCQIKCKQLGALSIFNAKGKPRATLFWLFRNIFCFHKTNGPLDKTSDTAMFFLASACNFLGTF